MLSFDEIMERMLNRVPTDVDKREGSIIWDALAPCAAELAQMYITLEGMLDLVFVDTSEGEYLTRKCNEMGVARKEATYATRKATIISSDVVPTGERFTIDDLVYFVVESTETNTYTVKCETAGIVGNKPHGRMIPVGYIEGISSAILEDVLIPGEDAETDAELKARYFEYVHEPAFGGNVADYKRKVKELDGVGQVKVLPVWNGEGTVKLLILDSSNNVPSETLLNSVRVAVSPTDDEMGFGIAPIGHTVTIVGAEEEMIDITATITVLSNIDQAALTNTVTQAIEQYINSLKEQWENTESISIRVARVESKILDIQGVVDIADTTLNGNNSNLTVSGEKIPVIGNVVITYATT